MINKERRARTPLEIIADSPVLSQSYTLMALRGPTLESEMARHQWVAWANTVFVEPLACDCRFCELKRD
jgi:hypothetical protein